MNQEIKRNVFGVKSFTALLRCEIRAGVLRIAATEDGAGFFGHGNLVKEVTDLRQLVRGDHDAFDLIGPFVVKNVVFHLHVALIGGVVAMRFDRLRKIVNNVANWKGDVEHVGLQGGADEFDRIFSSFSGQNGGTFLANHAMAKDEQVSGGFGVAFDGEMVIERQRVTIFFEIADGCASQSEIIQEGSQKSLDNFAAFGR